MRQAPRNNVCPSERLRTTQCAGSMPYFYLYSFATNNIPVKTTNTAVTFSAAILYLLPSSLKDSAAINQNGVRNIHFLPFLTLE